MDDAPQTDQGKAIADGRAKVDEALAQFDNLGARYGGQTGQIVQAIAATVKNAFYGVLDHLHGVKPAADPDAVPSHIPGGNPVPIETILSADEPGKSKVLAELTPPPPMSGQLQAMPGVQALDPGHATQMVPGAIAAPGETQVIGRPMSASEIADTVQDADTTSAGTDAPKQPDSVTLANRDASPDAPAQSAPQTDPSAAATTYDPAAGEAPLPTAPDPLAVQHDAPPPHPGQELL